MADEVIDVSSPVKANDPRPEFLARLRRLMGSLRLSATPIDVGAEQARLRSGS